MGGRSQLSPDLGQDFEWLLQRLRLQRRNGLWLSYICYIPVYQPLSICVLPKQCDTLLAMLPVIANIGPVSISSFGVFLALSLIVTLFTVWRVSRSYDVD